MIKRACLKSTGRPACVVGRGGVSNLAAQPVAISSQSAPPLVSLRSASSSSGTTVGSVAARSPRARAESYGEAITHHTQAKPSHPITLSALHHLLKFCPEQSSTKHTNVDGLRQSLHCTTHHTIRLAATHPCNQGVCVITHANPGHSHGCTVGLAAQYLLVHAMVAHRRRGCPHPRQLLALADCRPRHRRKASPK